jgi:hypothetical protein
LVLQLLLLLIELLDGRAVDVREVVGGIKRRVLLVAFDPQVFGRLKVIAEN